MKRQVALLVGLGLSYEAMAGESLAPLPPSMELGVRLLNAGEASLALGAFNRALSEDGLNAEALIGIGAAMHKLGRRKEALRVMKSAVDLDPNLALARNNLGVLLYEMGEISAAVFEFERAFALTGGADDRISTNLGIAEFNASMEDTDEIIANDFDFDVIQYGHGVYRLEPRAAKGDEGDTVQSTVTGGTQ